MAAMAQVRVGYEDDPFAWIREQAALLRAHQIEGLDGGNLAEEIDSTSRQHLPATDL